MADDCIFCKIVAGEIPAHVIYEDERTLAFLDVAPSVPGHTLLIPKLHAEDVWTIDPDEFATVAISAQKVAQQLRDRLQPDGMNLINSCRPAGWQTVFHLHVHVIPRFAGDSLAPPWRPTPAEPEALAEMAQRLR